MPLNLIAQYVPIVASLLLLAFGGYFYIQFNKANNLYKGNEAATPFSLLEARNRRLAHCRGFALKAIGASPFPLIIVPYFSDSVHVAATAISAESLLLLIYLAILVFGKVKLGWFSGKPLWIRLIAAFFIGVLATSSIFIGWAALLERDVLQKGWELIKEKLKS